MKTYFIYDTISSINFFVGELMKAKQQLSNYEQSMIKSRNIKLGISVAITLLFYFSGLIFQPTLTEKQEASYAVIFLFALVFPTLLLCFNVIYKKSFQKRLKKKPVTYLQNLYLKHREQSETAAKKKLKVLKLIKFINFIYGLFLLICGCFVAFSLPSIYEFTATFPLLIIAAIYIAVFFTRLYLPDKKSYFKYDKTYVDEKDFPELYSLAYKAAKALGIKNEIKISLLPECNSGIAKIGNTYSVQIGVILLELINDEELYNVLLHEFSHATNQAFYSNKLAHYNNWLDENNQLLIGFPFSSHFFKGLDIAFAFNYDIYSYTISIWFETEADKSMAKFGNPQVAASVLLKLKYYELYDWQCEAYDFEPYYLPEKQNEKTITKTINQYKEFEKKYSSLWNECAEKEILSRSASHPTLKMRFETIGATEFKTIDSKKTDALEKESKKAVEFVEKLLIEERADEYDDLRNANYIEPSETIKSWEENGKEIIPETYHEIINSLRFIGRNDEALELCDRVIAELDSVASCYATYIKAIFLMRRFDESGIDLMYSVTNNYSNYIQDGLSVIGYFCCITGNQEELDKYRTNAVNLAQLHKDEYSQLSVLNKGDRLSSENLPEELLTSILDYILQVSDNTIDNIYLVRKTISESLFTSVFIIKFNKDVETQVKYEVIDKIFNHLDTCSDWQFSLFDYVDVAKVKPEKIENSCVYSRT